MRIFSLHMMIETHVFLRISLYFQYNTNAVQSIQVNPRTYKLEVITYCLNVTRIALQAIGQKILPVLSSVIELAGKIVFAFLAIPAYGYPAVIVCEPLIWCLMVLELMLSFWLNPYIRRNHQPGPRAS